MIVSVIHNIIENTRKFAIMATRPTGGARSVLKKLYKMLPRQLRISYIKTECVNYLKNDPNIQIVQIGANDGIHDDVFFPLINKLPWECLMVEPNTCVITVLKKNHSNSAANITFENCGIGDESGSKTLYWCRELPSVASFSKWHVEKHADGKGFAILEQTVPVLTFNDLLVKYPEFRMANLLLLDTEGYDGIILLSIDFSKFKPDMIIFENIHIGSKQLEEVYRLLNSLEYSLYKDKEDTVAIKNISANKTIREIARVAHKL